MGVSITVCNTTKSTECGGHWHDAEEMGDGVCLHDAY